MILVQTQAAGLEKLQAAFDLYATYNRRELPVLLARKGRGIGIKLFQGYRARRPGSKSYALTELRARTRAGQGTLVRDRVLRDKWINRIPRTWPGRKRRGKGPKVLNRQQMLVGQEVLRRKAGRGALAASFFWMRGRSSQARGSHYVKNRVARVLGQVDVTPDQFRIRGYMEGLAMIDTRYAITTRALAASDRDMQAYIARKQAEIAKQALVENGLPAR